MASASSNHTVNSLPSSSSEAFSKFFEQWLTEQDHYLHQLNSAADAYSHSPESTNSSLRSLINRVIHHYEHYYLTKSNFTKQDVLAIINPSWLSSLEDAFLWIGGWRPSMAFHLLYSKSGLEVEATLDQFLLRGMNTSEDLWNLSSSQLRRVDQLQRETIKEERQISDEMAAHQETVADSSMVEISHLVSELNREGGGEGGNGVGEESLDERVETTLEPKEKGFEEIVLKADDLRLKTLKNVVDILTPIQAVHFCIAAAELHLRIHEWGKKKDAAQRGSGSTAAGQ